MQSYSGMGQSDCIQQCTDQLKFVQVLVIAVVMTMMMVVVITCLLNYYRHSSRSLIPRDGQTRQGSTAQTSQIHTPRLPDQCHSYQQQDCLGRFQPTYPYLFQSIIELPPSITLSDGEEPPPYHGACSLQLRDHEQQLELNRESVRAPPNRTIFDSHLIDTFLCPPSMNAGVSVATSEYTPPAYSEVIRHYGHPSSPSQYIQTSVSINSPPLICGNVSSDLLQINSMKSQKTGKEKPSISDLRL